MRMRTQNYERRMSAVCLTGCDQHGAYALRSGSQRDLLRTLTAQEIAEQAEIWKQCRLAPRGPAGGPASKASSGGGWSV